MSFSRACLRSSVSMATATAIVLAGPGAALAAAGGQADPDLGEASGLQARPDDTPVAADPSADASEPDVASPPAGPLSPEPAPAPEPTPEVDAAPAPNASPPAPEPAPGPEPAPEPAPAPEPPKPPPAPTTEPAPEAPPAPTSEPPKPPPAPSPQPAPTPGPPKPPAAPTTEPAPEAPPAPRPPTPDARASTRPESAPEASEPAPVSVDRASSATQTSASEEADPPDEREVAESLLALLGWTSDEPSAAARDDLPDGWLRRYRDAADRCEGLDWAVLAGIGKVMSDHGREDVDEGGPMGLPEGAWRSHQVDGDDDGRMRIDDPDDAIHTAAERLCAFGAADDALISALRLARLEWSVVHEVLEHAVRYRTPISDIDADMPTASPAALLTNENLMIYPGGRDDLAAGRIDPRVRQLLATLAADHELVVSSLKTGHSKFVAGTTSVSNHWHGRAVDISMIDGVAVRPGEPTARALVAWLDALPADVGPDEVGSPFAEFAPRAGYFTDAAHQGHIHIGWRAAPIR